MNENIAVYYIYGQKMHERIEHLQKVQDKSESLNNKGIIFKINSC